MHMDIKGDADQLVMGAMGEMDVQVSKPHMQKEEEGQKCLLSKVGNSNAYSFTG
jgi:hypothetical protein